MKNEIILYQSGELSEHIEVILKEETVWLNRIQIATLFGRDVKTIGKHINNVFSEGELDRVSTVANFATVQIEGARKIERQIEYYNLDVKKANEQYGNYETKELKTSHDRFLILDREELYHIGASLKDLGKKWFAFSKLDSNMLNLMLEQIRKEVA